MNKNTGAQTITTFSFVGSKAESTVWTAEEVELWGVDLVDGFAEAHRENAADAGYTAEYGVAETFEYSVPGMRVVVLLTGGSVMTVWTIEDTAAAKLHRAVRREQPVTVTYTKADGEETVRTLEPTSLATTKAGAVIIRAIDRKSGEARSFRIDRISAYTVHRTRRTVRTERPAPSKAELWEAWTAVRHIRHGLTGTVVPGTRAYGPGGYSMIVKLDDSTATPGGTTRWSESELTTV